MSSEAKSSYNNLSLTALCIGVPVLVGASYYYLYYSSGSNNKKSNKDGSTSNGTTIKKKLTPLEELIHLKTIGNQNFSRKNYDAAIEHYTKAIELSETIKDLPTFKPEDLAIFFQNRAACLEALNQFDKVIEDCNEAIKLKKNYIKAYIRRAKAYEKSEQYDKAMVDAFAATMLDKFQNQTSVTLTDNIVKASSQAKALEAMKVHKPQWPSNQTIKSYFSAFSLDPIREKLGEPIINRAQQLEPLLQESLKEEHDNSPIDLLIRGSCLSLKGDMKSAQAAFDKLLSLEEDKVSPRMRANALIKKAAIVISEPTSSETTNEKDFENVFKLIDQALAIDPENPDIYLHKAQALTLSEKYLEAIETLNKAIELKGDLHSAVAQKMYIEFKLSLDASSFSSSQKPDELMKEFEKLIKKYPESQDLLQMYAQILTESNMFEKADEALIKLIELDPKDGSFYVSRALLQFHLNTSSDAITKLLKEALNIDPKIMFASEILGSIETQSGNLDEAIKIFETSLGYAQNKTEYERCYSLLDSAKCQKIATKLIE